MEARQLSGLSGLLLMQFAISKQWPRIARFARLDEANRFAYGGPKAVLCSTIATAVMLLNALPGFAGETTGLPAITVYGSRFGEKLEDILPQTTIINSEDIVQSGLTDVSQILQKLGNVPTRINLNGTQDLSIDLRGYGVNSDNNVVILLDGTRLSEIEQASARVSMIPVEVIDHIEISRGGASVLYGEGATSGVINIVTKKQTGDIATMSVKAGSFDTKESNIFASHQWDKTTISFYGKTLDTNNYRQNNAAQVRSGGATLQWVPEPTTALGVRVYADEQDTRLPGALTLAQFQLDPRQTSNPYDYGSTSGNSITAFGSTLYKSTELAVDINVRNKDANSTLPSLGGTTNSSANLISLSPRAKFHDALIKGNDLSLGVDLSKWDRTYSAIYPAFPQFSTVGEHLNQNSAATYFRDDWIIDPANRLTIGGRVEQIQKKIIIFTAYSNPNASNSLRAFEIQYTRSLPLGLQAYTRTGQSYRVPNIDDLRGAAASLVPQTAKDYEAGLSFQKLSRTNATLRVFRSDIHNEIIFDPVQFLNVNLPPTQREGIELEGRYQVVNTVAFRGSWQKIRALFVEGAYQGQHVPLVPNFNGQLGVEWKPAAHQTIDLSARFVGQQYQDGDFYNSLAPIPFFWTADLRYSSELTQRLNLVVAANNLLNKKYYDYANSFGGYYPSPGFNMSALLKYRF